MKKNKFIVPLCSFLSVAMIPVFAWYFDRTESLDAFISLCSPISTLAAKSSGFADTAPGFAAGPSTAIIKLPSLDSNGLPLIDDSDLCAVSASGRKLAFTCLPALTSRRQAETLSITAPKSITFTYTGSTLLLMAAIGRQFYAMDFEISKNYTVIPDNRKWF